MKLFAIVFFLGSVAHSSVPDFVVKTPKADSDYKYYVGRSAPTNSDAEASAAAEKNARETAAKDNFGATIKIDSILTDSSSQTSSQTRIEESSKRVQLIGFEFIEDYLDVIQTSEGKLYTKYILYRYSKSAIEQEKLRLASLTKPETAFSNFGADQDCIGDRNTELIVKSTEKGSKVFIDNELVGSAPLKIKCQYPAGVVLNVEVKKEHFVVSAAKTALFQGSPNTLNATLERERGLVIINSTPQGALVHLNGENVGLTPTKAIQFLVGNPYQLVLSHPKTENLSQTLTLDFPNVEAIEKMIFLPYRSGQFSVNIKDEFPTTFLLQSSEIKAIKNEIKKERCDYGNHLLRVTRSGYEDIVVSFKCEVGQNVDLGTIGFTSKLSPPLKKEAENTSNEYESIHELNFQYETPNFKNVDINRMGFGYLYRKQFHPFFSLDAGASYQYGYITFSDYKLSQSGMKGELGLGIIPRGELNNQDSSFTFSPTIQINTQTFKKESINGTSSDSTAQTVSKASTGFGLNMHYKEGSFSLKFGYFVNSDAGELKGKPNFQFSLGWAL